MPGIVLHTLLADTVLQRWKKAPGTAPFDPHDADVVGFFFKGSMAPDMGYYPGGVVHLSNQVHRARSAAASRELIRKARSPIEIAYAWGWVCHVLGDIILHPAINRAGSDTIREPGPGPSTPAWTPPHI
jgi:hypothetical protein